MPVYIENDDVDRLTNRQQGKYRAICLFESQKREKRQRFAIKEKVCHCIAAAVLVEEGY